MVIRSGTLLYGVPTRNSPPIPNSEANVLRCLFRKTPGGLVSIQIEYKYTVAPGFTSMAFAMIISYVTMTVKIASFSMRHLEFI